MKLLGNPKIILLAILLLAPACSSQQETILMSASELDYPPFAIVNEDGSAGGFSVELLNASVHAAGMDVSFYVAPWSQIKQELADGELDVLPLVGRTPEREPLYDFTVPYLTLHGGVFTRMGEEIKSPGELYGKEVLVMEGDNAHEYALRKNLSHIITTVSYEEAFRLLSQGKHDAIIAQEIVGNNILQDNNITNINLASRLQDFKQDWTFAVNEGDGELLLKLNDGLSRIITDGTYNRIYEKWFVEPEKTAGQEKPEFEYAKDSIRQRALDIAKQIELYLMAHPEKTAKDLVNNTDFRKLAIQQVGETGYTFVYKYETLTNLVHKKQKFEGLDYRTLKDEPGREKWWEITQPTQAGIDYDGTYMWKDPDGVFREKYKYAATVKRKTADGVGLTIAASTYLDEYGGKKEDEQETIAELSIKLYALQAAREIEEYLEKNPGKTIRDLQEDEEFREIAVQKVGATGYTALMDLDDSTIYFHPQKKLVDTKSSRLSAKLPGFWKIFEKTMGDECRESQGYYRWMEEDGEETQKYMYTACIGKKTADGKRLFLSATTYVNEIVGEDYMQKYGVGRPQLAYAKKSIREKAESVAKQIEIYLKANPGKTIKDLQQDEYFRDIAVQKVGNTGYTCLYEAETAVMRLHPNQALIDKDITYLKDELPSWWRIFQPSLAGVEVAGTYEWQEANGSITEKYMVMTPAAEHDGKTLMLAATTYMDEYQKPVETAEIQATQYAKNTIRQKAQDVAKQIELYLELHPGKTVEDLQEDARFREIAIQQVGETGYTSITDLESTEQLLTPQQEMVGKRLSDFKQQIPELWSFFEKQMMGKCTQGGITYNWPDEAGRVREKYAYGVCINRTTADGRTLAVDASTYLDEYTDNSITPEITTTTTIIHQTQQESRAYQNLPLILMILLVFLIIILVQSRAIQLERNTILLVVGVTILIIIAISTYSTYTITSNIREETILQLNQGQLRTAQLKAGYLEEKMRYLESKLVLLAEQAVHYEEEAREIGWILREEYEKNKGVIYAAYRINRTGHIALMYLLDDNSLGADISGQKHMKEVARTHKPVFSGLFGAVEGFKAITPHHPVMKDGEYDGTVAYLIPLTSLVQDAVTEGLSAHQEVWIIDDEGTILICPDQKMAGLNFLDQHPEEESPEKILSDIREGRTGFHTHRHKNNETHLTAYSPFNIGSNRLGLLVISVEETAYSPLSKELSGIWRTTFITLSLILLTGIIFSSVLTRTLRKEVAEKTSALEKLNRELDKKVADRTMELEALSTSLEKQVKDRTIQLEGKVGELEKTRSAILNMMEDIQEAKIGLEEKVEERTKELSIALEEVKKADQVKDDFLAITSHELKTPLTSIIGLTELIEDELKDELNDDQRQDFQVVLTEANRLKKLIEQILELARLDAGKKVFNFQQVELKTLFKDIEEEFKPYAQQHEVTFNLGEIKAETVWADHDSLNLLINNLVSNAIRYTAEKKGEVTLSAHEDEEKILITIKDTGIGIPEDKSEKIFERFYQVDTSTSRKYGGTGLGLSISLKIVQAHNGEIKVESTLGEGSKFTIILEKEKH